MSKHKDTYDRLQKERKAVFERLEQWASKPDMTPQERAQYEEEWKNYNDLYNTLDFAEQQGYQKGIRYKANMEIARKLKEFGMDSNIIAAATELSLEEIENL